MVGLLVAAGWYVTGYLGADDFNPDAGDVAHLHRADRRRLQYVMLSTGLTLNFGIVTVAVCSPAAVTALATGPLSGWKAIRRHATCCARPVALR